MRQEGMRRKKSYTKRNEEESKNVTFPRHFSSLSISDPTGQANLSGGGGGIAGIIYI